MSQNEQQGLMGISSRKGKEFAVHTFLLIRGFYSESVIYSLKHIKNMCCSIKNMGFPGGASGKEPNLPVQKT